MSEHKWELSRLGTGERTALKRSAGSAEPDVAAWRAFYIACGACTKWQEKSTMAALCMECLWRAEDAPRVLPMESCLRYLRFLEGATSSLDKRISGLLETDWDERDGFLLGKMLNLVKIIKSKTDMKPDFESLADDLQRWNHASRVIQRKWLKEIYATRDENDKEDTNHDA